MDGLLQPSCVTPRLSDIYSPIFSPATFLSLCESLRGVNPKRSRAPSPRDEYLALKPRSPPMIRMFLTHNGSGRQALMDSPGRYPDWEPSSANRSGGTHRLSRFTACRFDYRHGTQDRQR